MERETPLAPSYTQLPWSELSSSMKIAKATAGDRAVSRAHAARVRAVLAQRDVMVWPPHCSGAVSTSVSVSTHS